MYKYADEVRQKQIHTVVKVTEPDTKWNLQTQQHAVHHVWSFLCLGWFLKLWMVRAWLQAVGVCVCVCMCVIGCEDEAGPENNHSEFCV